MANVQLQKPQTITTTAIVQQQSQEVVQTIVHGGVCFAGFFRLVSLADQTSAEQSILFAVSAVDHMLLAGILTE